MIKKISFVGIAIMMISLVGCAALVITEEPWDVVESNKIMMKIHPSSDDDCASGIINCDERFEEKVVVQKNIEPITTEIKVVKKVLPVFDPAYFNFNKFNLRPDDTEVLDIWAEYLFKNTEVIGIIEGHCDERGSKKYNQWLGDMRAISAKIYLVSKGIKASRLTTVSFGEDIPIDPAHNKQAWVKNRRAELKLLID